MPNSLHSPAIFSPSSTRATNRRRSSILEHSCQGTFALRGEGARSVTYVSGMTCYLSVDKLIGKGPAFRGLFFGRSMASPPTLLQGGTMARLSTRRCAIVVAASLIGFAAPAVAGDASGKGTAT